jgi:hypothetical protein
MLLHELKSTIGCIIIESREDNIVAKYGDKILQRYQTDVQRHPNITRSLKTPLQIIQHIASNTDPKLINWTTAQYLKGAFSLEDVEIIKQDIVLFNNLKSILPKKDIGSYKTLDELRNTIAQYESQLGKKTNDTQ